jgi:hypothetical protein
VTQIRDQIEQLERKLDKGDLDFLNRRLLLRQVLEVVAREAFENGRYEGMRDIRDARNAEEEKMLASIAEANAERERETEGG